METDAPARPAGPLAALLLVHGAGSDPSVFDGWEPDFPELRVEAVDLQAGLDPARASMADYAAAVVRAAVDLPRPLALCGWSMGGLVALTAAGAVAPAALVAIEASAPAEVQGYHPEVELRRGVFDPEAEYGRFPPGIRARPESLLARCERKRGVSVPTLPCPSLVVFGRDFAEERGRALARLYGSASAELPELDHVALVRSPEVRRAIRRFLGLGARAA